MFPNRRRKDSKVGFFVSFKPVQYDDHKRVVQLLHRLKASAVLVDIDKFFFPRSRKQAQFDNKAKFTRDRQQ